MPTIVALLVGVAFAAAGNGLTETIASIPAALEEVTVAYTDWAGIKAEMGVPWLTGDASYDVKVAFGMRLDVDHALGSAFGLSRLSVHAETWGFDSIDLEWETQITADGIPPTYLLKLREDIDLDVVIAHFEERGFTRNDSYGGAIYSRSIDADLDWIRTTELAIHNTGVLEDERLLVLSSSFPVVELLLATLAGEFVSLSTDEATAALVDRLDDPLAAYLMIGRSTCLRFSPNPVLDLIGSSVDESPLDDLRAWLDSGEPLYGYSALGVGYHHVEGRPVGTVVFVYPSADDAAHDLEPRRLLAESGASSHYERPIAEAFFVLEDARVDEAVILFAVRPVNDQPRRLFQMIIYADAPFAACR